MEYAKLADKKIIVKTMGSLKKRGIKAEIVNTRKEALDRLFKLIPQKSEIMAAGSTTLEEIGFTEILKNKAHKWNNLKDKILAEKDEAKQLELRKKSAASQYTIGSVHAVAETGEILIASASGSQIPSYAYSSKNVIWIVGTQKIVKDIEDGIERIRKYCLPLEDKRMRNKGADGSTIGKILIFEREIMNRNITLIFVNEKLGF